MKEARHKDHILYDYIRMDDSIYMKCPEKATLRRQKVDQWLTGAGGENGD